MKQFFIVSLLVIFLCASVSGQVIVPVNPVSVKSPCYLVMVDRSLFGEWETVPVYAAPLQQGCGSTIFTVQRWDSSREEIERLTIPALQDLSRRVKIGELSAESLGKGLYRISSDASITKFFVVGGADSSQIGLQVVQPGAYQRDGNLYFQAMIWALYPMNAYGWMYQIKSGGVFESHLVTVQRLLSEAEAELCPNDIPGNLGCVKVKLPENDFDFMSPIHFAFHDGIGKATDGLLWDLSSMSRDLDSESSAEVTRPVSRRIPPRAR